MYKLRSVYRSSLFERLSKEYCEVQKWLTGLFGVTSTMARVACVINFAHSLVDGWNPSSGDVLSHTGFMPSIVSVILSLVH